MDPKAAFNVWSPAESRWAQWAKPVPFAINPHPEWGGTGPLALPDVSGWDGAMGDTALVINLPAVESIAYGLGLAQRGFQPVPLFNAADGPNPVRDAVSVARALYDGVDVLQRAIISADAPPAFLIDSERLDGDVRPGNFDNRWVVFPQDFPSALLMQAHGIKRVLVLQRDATKRDLLQVLSMWHKDGLEVLVTGGGSLAPDPAGQPQFTPMNRFSFMRMAMPIMLISSFGLRRNSAGGFGSVTPMPSRGG